MKSTLAILCGLALSAALTTAHAEDGEFSTQDKLLLTSLNEINMTTATVTGVFEYCMKQDPDFAMRALETLQAWRTRNEPFIALSPMLREEAMVFAEREGMTCIDCHFGIAHQEPEGPGPQEIDFSKL